MPDSPTTLAAKLSGIEKSFGKNDSLVHVLKGADFTARLGEMQLLIGPSGCGKTTLLSILCGTLRPDSGEVIVFGEALHSMPSSRVTKFRGVNIGFVFQQFNLIPTLSIAENVAVPLLINGCSTSKAEKLAREVLGRVGLEIAPR